MSQDRVMERLLSLAAERFARSREDLKPEDDLFDALEIDSMQALSLLTALEESFSVEIPDYEVQDVRTFGALAALIADRI